MKAAPDVSRMKAAPDVSRMKAAPDVSRMKAAPVLLVLLLLCVCEVGVGGAQDSPPSLSDVMKEVKVLRGMVADQRGDRAAMAARCAIQKKLDSLQSNLASRLSASEAKMGEAIKKLQQELEKSSYFELVRNDLANVTDSYKQLQSSYQQLISTCNPVTEEEQKKRLKNLCESDGFKWDDLDGVCYYVSTETKTWAESRRFCKARQADLMIVNSQEKQDLVDPVIPSSTDFWIGLTDRDREGSYKWVDGTTVTSPTFWYPGEPTDTKGDLDCVRYINNGGSSRGWLDYTCSSSLRWICERVVQ